MLSLLLLLQLGFAEEVSAKDLFYNAVSFVETEQYDLAIEAFKKSYELSKRSMILYNISQVYEKMEEYDLALDYLNQYRMFATEDERDSLSNDTLRLKELQSKKQKILEEEEKKRQAEQKRQHEEQAKIEEEKKRLQEEEEKRQQEIEQQKLMAEQQAIEKEQKRNSRIRMGTGIGLIVTTSVGIYSVIQLQDSISFIDSHCNGYCIDHGMDDSEKSILSNIDKDFTMQRNSMISAFTGSLILLPFPFIYKKIDVPEVES
jgi:tetratricopeptide (TPR) repeat protein